MILLFYFIVFIFIIYYLLLYLVYFIVLYLIYYKDQQEDASNKSFSKTLLFRLY